MRAWIIFPVLAGWAAGLAPAQDLPPGVLLLARVKAHLRTAMARLPDYTCTETLLRSRRAPRQMEMKPVDVVRLEVLYSGDSELFAYPGSRTFDHSDPGSFVAGGLVGNGTFAGFLKTVLLNGHALITFRGEEDLRGRRTARYDYVVAPHLSGYTIEVSGTDAQAGMKGAVWVDPESLDVLRLHVEADQVPQFLGIRETVTTVNYARASIGGQEAMVPESGEMRMLMTSGEEGKNTFEFTQCRTYSAESTLKFDGIPDVTSKFLLEGIGKAVPSAPAEIALPAGLSITIVLTAPVSEKQAVGAAIDGRIAGNVTANRKVLIPDGAVVHGRVRRMERYTESGGYFGVGLEFTEIEIAGGRSRFLAELTGVDPLPGFEWEHVSNRDETRDGGRTTVTRLPNLPGVGSFFIRGKTFEVPAGFKMVWRTLPPAK